LVLEDTLGRAVEVAEAGRPGGQGARGRNSGCSSDPGMGRRGCLGEPVMRAEGVKWKGHHPTRNALDS
jgi:hypothetical protein